MEYLVGVFGVGGGDDWGVDLVEVVFVEEVVYGLG